jgi:hypothetical protein
VLIAGKSGEDAVNRYGSSAWIERLSPVWQPTFTKVFRGGEQTIAYDAAELSSGGYVIVGTNKRYAASSKPSAWAPHPRPEGTLPCGRLCHGGEVWALSVLSG